MSPLSTFALAALLASPSLAAYTLRRDHSGNNFINAFEFRTAADYPDNGDPTGGFVNYVNEATARSKGLVKVTNGQVYLGADSTTKVATSAQGRNSLRLEAKEPFTFGLLIADIAHMPGSICGVWPAFWTFNFDENPYGEIDIIEGVSNQPRNDVSFHTCGACSFNFNNQERLSCNLGNEQNGCGEQEGVDQNFWGCGDEGPANSFGTPFNNVQGGVYATEITSTFVKIWFFPRASIPADIKSGKPTPASWSAPFINAQKSQKGCDTAKFFKNQKIIINTDFCGSNIPQEDWDRDTTCKAKAASCPAYVGNNPSAFTEAYWLFNSIKLYQQ